MSKRLKIVTIPLKRLTGWLSWDGSGAIRIMGLPEDANIVGVSECFDEDKIAFKIESAEFPEVEMGRRIPELILEVRTFDVSRWAAEHSDEKLWRAIMDFMK